MKFIGYALLIHFLCLLVDGAEYIRHFTTVKPNSYIVVFKEHVGVEAALLHMARVEVDKLIAGVNAMTDDQFSDGLPQLITIPEADGTPMIGYVASLADAHVEMLRQDPDIEYIEEDQIITVDPWYVTTDDTEDGPERPPWGLARISHRDWSSDNSKTEFLFSEADGSGVKAYVIDTGIDISHPDFGGRARYGKSFVRDTTTGDYTRANDANGHGTHVAGIIGSNTCGVAKMAELIAVRVLDGDGSGTLSDVIAGVGWVVKEHLKKPTDKSVINMSLGGMRSPTLDRAVNGAASSGVHVVVAAGNEATNACNGSPSGADKVLTVGASTQEDGVAFFSNYGPCLDVFAPGHFILSTWLNGQYKLLSGTSMASPHVAGIAAALLSRSEEKMSPSKLIESIVAISTKDVLEEVPHADDTVNALAYNCPEIKCDVNTDFVDSIKETMYKTLYDTVWQILIQEAEE